MLSARELFPSRHHVVAGRPHEIPNQVELMGVALAGNNGLSHKHFAKYTAVGGQLWATPSKKKQKMKRWEKRGLHSNLTQHPTRQWPWYTVSTGAVARAVGTIA